MQIRNNRGEIISEINSGVTDKGDRFTTNTTYDQSGNPVFQYISIRQTDGTVRTTNVFGAKILP